METEDVTSRELIDLVTVPSPTPQIIKQQHNTIWLLKMRQEDRTPVSALHSVAFVF